MAASKGAHWSNAARASLAAMVLAGAGFVADPAGADIIKKEDMLRGFTMTRAQCAAIQQTVWVNAYDQDFCVRYYLSTAGGEGSRPVVFWNGDSNGPLEITRDGSGNVVSRAWSNPSRAQDVNTDSFMEIADDFSKMAKTTAIYIGRIGVEGTSGNHMSRKTLVELHLMNAALDALKRRYGFEGFHLAGESGGARLAFSLAGTRRDIGCVVSASGQLGIEEGGATRGDPGQIFIDVMGVVVPSLAQNRAVRLMVITDPADQQVPPAEQQNPIVARLQAGRPSGLPSSWSNRLTQIITACCHMPSWQWRAACLARATRTSRGRLTRSSGATPRPTRSSGTKPSTGPRPALQRARAFPG